MERGFSRQPGTAEAERIIADLSTRQYLDPHRSLGRVLAESREALGFCPAAGATALGWLNLDAGLPVGRLRRGELIQLARSIHRFWLAGLSAGAAHAEPA